MTGDLPECCAGEGYPGIAHDLLTARRERDQARDALRFYATRPWADGYPGGVYVDDAQTTLDFGDIARAALAGVQVEAREGVVTVYDHDGRYLGCMGIETWRAALAGEQP